MEPPSKFVPLAKESPKVVDWPPQVINEDYTAVTAGSDRGADEDDKVMEVDNPAGILSSN